MSERTAEPAWTDRQWASADGLTLHYRDYAGREDRPPLLCIPGLTRNARDFEPVAEAFAGEWRVIAVDLRGRGQSDDAKDAASYNPAQYVADIEALLEQAGIARFVAVGTSLGGIVTMLLAARDPARIAGAVINDIGPVVEDKGLDRIREYLGQARTFPSWMHAARSLRDTHGAAHPGYEIGDWLVAAKRMMSVGGNGRIAFDYDMKIAEPFNAPPPATPADLWPAWRALGGRPVLVLRGALSDLLSRKTFARMAKELPDADLVTVARTGHAPSLGEPEAREAIARLLAKCA
ncbi:MAG TPA: alpha/beta hydrolase [Sphingomonadaceae bacterium]